DYYCAIWHSSASAFF
nr:immunoglobulin light chain junction region [Macaca mulatta]MOV98079.1 immunoglobulin light chain junction region [Macaca mulatta]MOW00160.1 immunoglobulin light chain junction region [Macaca mulatta]MOW00327.1 immunoglobulin light chain junction region [Macaca mulatta]MOW00992.1 immunoglobulin light chain junction region [Macaca mulatta]